MALSASNNTLYLNILIICNNNKKLNEKFEFIADSFSNLPYRYTLSNLVTMASPDTRSFGSPHYDLQLNGLVHNG